MVHRMPRRGVLPLMLAATLALGVAACGEAEPEFTQEQATALIRAQWPDSELEMRNTYVDEEARGVAAASFNGELWEFYFQPDADGGWTLEAVGVEGGFYYLSDLEQISATMLSMGEMAGALSRYQSDNGAYPTGDSPETLQVLVPDYLGEDATLTDAWEREYLYESDGTDYTLTSLGPDGERGTRDDINLHSGEFVGTQGQGGQGQ